MLAELTSVWAWGTLVGVGTALGLIIAYVASREYIKQTMEVLKNTIKTQEENLKAKDELALSLAETQKQALVASETRLTVMTAERDTYRQTLHDERKIANKNELELQELKLRPDLNVVLQKEEEWHARREKFYTQMAENQTSIMALQRDCLTIVSNVQRDVKADLEQSYKVCTEVSTGLKEVVQNLDERDKRQAKREEEMMVTLTAILNELKQRPLTASLPANGGMQHNS